MNSIITGGECQCDGVECGVDSFCRTDDTCKSFGRCSISDDNPTGVACQCNQDFAAGSNATCTASEYCMTGYVCGDICDEDLADAMVANFSSFVEQNWTSCSELIFDTGLPICENSLIDFATHDEFSHLFTIGDFFAIQDSFPFLADRAFHKICRTTCGFCDSNYEFFYFFIIKLPKFIFILQQSSFAPRTAVSSVR